MIINFAHKGLEKFFLTGSKAGIQATHASRLALMLHRLNEVSEPAEMDMPGWGLHPLHGDLKGHFSVKVSGNWRLTFKFMGKDASLVNYQDYH